MIRYLLGDLPDEDKARLEERFLSDDDCYERLSALEEDLIEAYIHHELEEADRVRFEQYFMQSPMQRERVERAAALWQALEAARRSLGTDEPGKPRSSSWRPPFLKAVLIAAALLLLTLGVSWLVRERGRMHVQITRLQAELTRKQQEQNELRAASQRAQQEEGRLRQLVRELEARPQGLPARRETTTGPGLKIVTLLSGRARDIDVSPLPVLTLAGQPVQFRLLLEQTYPYLSYNVHVRLNDRLLTTQTALPAQPTPSGPVVDLLLGPLLLSPGEGQIVLSGVTAGGKETEIKRYDFRVVKN